MKRNIVNILLTLLSVATLAACDFLEEKSEVTLTQTEVFNTEGKLEAQIYGIVEAFYQSDLFMGTMQEYLHSASGMIIWKSQRLAEEWVDGLSLTKFSTDTKNAGRYAQLYTGIARCNRLLDGLKSSPVDPEFKSQIEGEAKFYRAIFYYTLVRLYGDVPLILEPVKDIRKSNNPRTAYYKVYASIMNDLDDAERQMRSYADTERYTPGKGRPCKWAATAFKASVYMTIGSMLTSFEEDPEDQFFDISKDAALVAQGKDPRTPDFSALDIHNASQAWTLAYSTAEKVIVSGPYSLEPDYRTLFRWTEDGDWTLSERIFVLQSTVSVKSGNNLAIYSLPQYCEGTMQTSIENSNYGRYRPSRFYFQKFAGDNGGVLGTSTSGEDNGIYVSCPDPRFDATFFHTGYVNMNTGSKTRVYPYYKSIRTNSSTGAFPYFKKYCDPRFNVNAGYADFYMMRLAEMYLISAEAAANLSSGVNDSWWGTALKRVEDIHSRARNSVDKGSGKAKFPSWDDRSFENTQELRDAIIWERFYELGGEGHEYFDTHRCGAKWLSRVVAEPLNEHLKRFEQSSKEGSPGVWEHTYLGGEIPTGQKNLRKSLLCAFPFNEAMYNTAIDPVLDQNDFYWQ